MTEKQLIVVVEGTAALGPFWSTIVADYLDKIIRYFCGNELNGQKPSVANPELALVVFNTHGPHSAFVVQRSGWTRDMDAFFHWLSGIPFCGGGFSEAAIAEGLAEALMMFPTTQNGNQNHQNHDVQKHCILVAASNPHPLPTPVYRPPIPSLENNEKADASTDTNLSDAETVAKSFGQYSLSLSVISPKQLPKLRAIYNAGKRNPRAADPSMDQLKNPQFLVLLSESFVEARTALIRPLVGGVAANQGIVKLDGAPAAAIPGPLSASIPSVNGSMACRQPVAVGNVPTATVKLEPTTVSSMVSTYSQNVSVASQGAPSLQTSSPSPTSQEMNANSEPLQELKPIVNPVQPSLRSVVPVGPAAAANVSILNSLSQHRQMINSASIAGASSIGLQNMGTTPIAMHMSNMISSGMTSSAMTGMTSVAGSGALMSNAQPAQNSTLGTFSSASSNISGNSNIGISAAVGNLQSSIPISQSVSGIGQGGLTSNGQLGQGMGMNQNMMNGLGATAMSSGPGTMMPTPGMSQQGGIHSLGLNNNPTMNLPMAHPSGMQAPSKYVKIWEGNLSGQRQGEPVFICKLEGYRNATASESLAQDWPHSMQIVRLIAQDHMNNKQYDGKADYLVFRTLNQHGFLGQLQEKKLCAVIQLPSQTLLLSVSDKAARLIGMLFPGDMVVFKPQVSSQQQQLQQQQLQQQSQQNQHLRQQQQLQQQQQMQQQQQQQMQQQQQQQQQQQMVGAGMSQAFLQGPGRSQLLSQGKLPSQGPGSMNGGGFLPQ